jgi:nitrous oxide reductase
LIEYLSRREGDAMSDHKDSVRRVASAVALAGLVTAGAALLTTAAHAQTAAADSPRTALVNVTPGEAGTLGCNWIARNPCCQEH